MSVVDCDLPNFSSPDAAIEHYKNLATDLTKRLETTQQELEEFQDGSRELEAELEMQLEQTETKIRDLRSENNQLHIENGRLQVRLNGCQGEMSLTIGKLQEELVHEKRHREDLQNYVRKLEQKNDDLERAMRASLSSLEDFEGRLNHAIERNAFLENELDEKENMAVVIQRLKDETRDLKQELIVHDVPKTNDLNRTAEKLAEKITPSNKYENENSPSRYRLKKSLTLPNNVNTSQAVSYSALNIVGDLLKKVGVLESKLQSCRESIKEGSDHLVVDKCAANKLASPNHVRHINGSTLSAPKDFIPLTA